MSKNFKHLLAMMMVLGMAVMGCSSAPASETDVPVVNDEVKEMEVEEQSTVTVEHQLGTTEVEVSPENVVVFDYGILDSLDYMGVEITGVPQSSSMPEHLSKFDGSEYANGGSLKEVDLEAVYEMQPGLIIISGRQSDYYEELSEIAPTIFMGIDNENYLESFKENMTILGEIFEKEEFVAEELTKIEESVASLNEKVTATGANALITLVNDGSVSAYGHVSRFGIIHNTFGFIPADENIEVSTHGQNVSFEYVLEVNPDYLFVVDRGAATGTESTAKALLDNELINATNASLNDHIVYLNANVWYTASGGFTSTQMMIDEVSAAIQ